MTNDNKDTGVGEVNKKIQAVIDAVKGFGIKEADIKIQNLSIYQKQRKRLALNRIVR